MAEIELIAIPKKKIILMVVGVSVLETLQMQISIASHMQSYRLASDGGKSSSFNIRYYKIKFELKN